MTDETYAFPHSWASAAGTPMGDHGMTLRDWFAGQVIVGLHCSPDVLRALNKAAAKNSMKFQDIAAAHAYSIADAMLETRKR